MQVEDRLFRLEGVHNFRDYGGYATRSGAKIKRGLLFRSGQHAEASDADLARIADLGLVTVVDLRGQSERRRHPCRRPQGFGAQVIYVEGETTTTADNVHVGLTRIPKGLAPHEAAGLGISSSAEAHANMMSYYTHLPFMPHIITLYRAYLNALAQGDGPTLINCMAGKDRTGLGVALVHKLLGVHEDDLLADYLLTNHPEDFERRFALMGETVRRTYGPRLDDAGLRTLLQVSPDYLEKAWQAIQDRHGHVEAYVRDALGVDEATIAKLRAHLLA